MVSYYQAQQVVMPALVVNFAFVFVNIVLNYVFVLGVGGLGGWGFIGSPIATASCRWLLLAVYWSYMFLWQRRTECWYGWTRRCLDRQRVRIMLVAQFLPLTLGFALEEFQLELISYFAIRIGEVELAVQNSTMTVFMVLSSVMFGLVAAATVRVGHWLGAGRPKAARKTALICLRCSLVIGAVTGLSFLLLRNYLGHVFSNDREFQLLTADVCLIVAPCYILLSVFYTSMAVLDAQARPMVVALSFVVGAWGVSVPLSYLFAFVLGQGLLGLWYAMCIGYSVVTLVSGMAALLSDWKRSSVEAMLRSEKKKETEAQEAEAGSGCEEDDDEEQQQLRADRQQQEQQQHHILTLEADRRRAQQAVAQETEERPTPDSDAVADERDQPEEEGEGDAEVEDGDDEAEAEVQEAEVEEEEEEEEGEEGEEEEEEEELEEQEEDAEEAAADDDDDEQSDDQRDDFVTVSMRDQLSAPLRESGGSSSP